MRAFQGVRVYLRRLEPAAQARLAELMDKNEDGQLTRGERAELKRLGNAVDRAMVENTRALARALRPELFDRSGRPQRQRVRQALASASRAQIRHSRAHA